MSNLTTTPEMTAEAGKVFTGSHCYEPDGSFHVVCMFVIGVSIFCGAISLVCTVKVIKLVVQIFRDPDNVRKSVKMYKLQPASQIKDDIELSCLGGSSNHVNIVKSSPVLTEPKKGCATTCSPETSERNGSNNSVGESVGSGCAASHFVCGGSGSGEGNVNNIVTVESVFIKEKEQEDSNCIC